MRDGCCMDSIINRASAERRAKAAFRYPLMEGRKEVRRLTSSGSGADISERDAADLLHKLITESILVQGLFLGSSEVAAGQVGRVFMGPDGLVWVRAGEQRTEPFLRFDPAVAVRFKYGDTRAFPDIPIPGDLRLASALIFVFADGSEMALFEIAMDPE